MIYNYQGVIAQQSPQHKTLTVVTKATDILRFAEIDRVGRSDSGDLRGFQRPQIASHIKEIRDYLGSDDAVLPNPIVVAFIDRVTVVPDGSGLARLSIDTTSGKPGFVVDGQQRLTALAGLPQKDFNVFMSVIVCESYDELRRQFILINSTRPLPKALIYELLPAVSSLPERLSSRRFAAAVASRLNHDHDSSLRGQIFQQTNPVGVIRDTAIQKVIMASVSDGALRELAISNNFQDVAYRLISDFYGAVRDTFPGDWEGHSPKTSRLLHGAGIVALGYVMELLFARDGARDRQSFRRGLQALVGKTAWTSGTWRLSDDQEMPWNAIENTPRQIMALAAYLVGTVKRAGRPRMLGDPLRTAVEA